MHWNFPELLDFSETLNSNSINTGLRNHHIQYQQFISCSFDSPFCVTD